MTAEERAGRPREGRGPEPLRGVDAALRAGSPLRAVVTEWVAGGSQTAPADLEVLDGTRVVAEVQAKLYQRATATAHEVVRSHYAGMGRLVASDRVDAVSGLLDRRLVMNPDGLRFADYRDARAHLQATVTAAGVSSEPVTLDAARRAAADPVRWADGRVLGSAGRRRRAGGRGAGRAGGSRLGRSRGARR